MGFVAETWTSVVSGQHRFLAEELTSEVASRMTDGVLRVSGLNAWTDAGRMANGMTWVMHITDMRGRAYGELEPSFAGSLNRYGIGEREWDHIRSTPLEEDGGSDWIKPSNIADRETGDRVMEMILNETEFAVPVPDLETRSLLNANVRRGTLPGEIIRSGPLMFKTFTVGMMLRHGGRMFDQPGIPGKLGYFVSLFLPVTIMGGLAIQLSEIAKGRDPRPMDDPKFWGAAIVKGGGLGVVGDLLGVTAQDRLGGWGDFAGGPLWSDLSHVAGGLWGMGRNTLADMGYDVDRDPRAGWELAKVTKESLPGQSLWYLRLALDRLVTDQIQSHIDPGYGESWRRVERMARQQNQGFWWAPGDPSPERAPDFENVMGGEAMN